MRKSERSDARGWRREHRLALRRYTKAAPLPSVKALAKALIAAVEAMGGRFTFAPNGHLLLVPRIPAEPGADLLLPPGLGDLLLQHKEALRAELRRREKACG